MDERPANRPAVIITGGDPVDPAAVASLPPDALVIAADSGLDLAHRLGIDVDVVVGDLDSAEAESVQRARAMGAEMLVYPADKDATDLELAIDAALRGDPSRVILLGGRGGRIAHLLGNVMLLAAPRLADTEVEWRFADSALLRVLPGRPVRLTGRIGDVVSIIAIGGPAIGVTTDGLRWILDRATLEVGSTRGISNEMVRPTATVSLDDGLGFVVHERNP